MSNLSIYNITGYLIKDSQTVQQLCNIFLPYNNEGANDEEILMHEAHKSFAVLSVKKSTIYFKSSSDSICSEGDNEDRNAFYRKLRTSNANQNKACIIENNISEVFFDVFMNKTKKNTSNFINNADGLTPEEKQIVKTIITNDNVVYGKMIVKLWH